MKILFDHQIFSYQTYGGISRYFFELMNQFQQREDPAFQLALKYSDNVYLQGLPGVPVKQMPPVFKPGSKARFVATYLQNKRLCSGSLKRGEFDVFHPTFFDDYFLARLQGKPFVLTLMDMTPELFPELFPRTSLYNRMVTSRWIDGKRTLARNATRIIAISETTKNDVVRFYGIDAKKIDVIYLASSIDSRMDTDGPASGSSRPFLLFVGSRFGYKNFTGFADAVAPLLEQDANLGVVCVGGGPFGSDEQSMLAGLGVRDRFTQSDASDPQLVTLYKEARAFVFPSRYEGFGIPIVEAFSCGCPCAISRSSCFPEIAGDAATYFDPDNLESMTETLRQVVYNEGLRRKLIADGLERAKPFSWEKTATQTLAVYKAACA